MLRKRAEEDLYTDIKDYHPCEYQFGLSFCVLWILSC